MARQIIVKLSCNAKQVIDALGEAGRLMAEAFENYTTSTPLEDAQAIARVVGDAQCLGFSDEETIEVIAVWQQFFDESPWPTDWNAVRDAFVARVHGQEWRPPA